MSSRMRRRAEAVLTLACAPLEDALADAKETHDAEGSPDSLASKRQAMATMHQTRAWLRAADELDRLPGEIAELEKALKPARRARDEKAAERVASLERKLAHAQAKLARIDAQFGPLVAEMNALAGGGS